TLRLKGENFSKRSNALGKLGVEVFLTASHLGKALINLTQNAAFTRPNGIRLNISPTGKERRKFQALLNIGVLRGVVRKGLVHPLLLILVFGLRLLAGLLFVFVLLVTLLLEI